MRDVPFFGEDSTGDATAGASLLTQPDLPVERSHRLLGHVLHYPQFSSKILIDATPSSVNLDSSLTTGRSRSANKVLENQMLQCNHKELQGLVVPLDVLKAKLLNKFFASNF